MIFTPENSNELKLIIDNSTEKNDKHTRKNVKAIAETGHLAIDGLIKGIPENTNIPDKCVKLGWDDTKDLKQRHLIVAVVDIIINVAIERNWHLRHSNGFFYIYDGAKWEPLDDAMVKLLLKTAAIQMGVVEIEARHSGFVEKLFQQAIQDGFFGSSTFQKISGVNLKNGTLLFDETGVHLREFNHLDFFTYRLDFDYDQKAVSKLWKKFLDRVLPDQNTQRTLQEVLGYLFIKGLKLELIFFLYGTGANGKSVIFETLSGILGPENISNYSLESLHEPYYRAMIKDKTVNYAPDIKFQKIDPGVFKTLASGEPIEARLPYREPFLMTDYAKLIFNVNRMDITALEHTHGFYRRLLIIPFSVTIPQSEQDRDLHKKLLTERAGVLNWIIEGADRVIRNRDIFISDECQAARASFIKEADSCAMFEQDFISESVRDKGNEYFETVTMAYKNYTTYCSEAGFKNCLGRNNFTKRMEALGFSKIKNEKGYFLKKIF